LVHAPVFISLIGILFGDVLASSSENADEAAEHHCYDAKRIGPDDPRVREAHDGSFFSTLPEYCRHIYQPYTVLTRSTLQDYPLLVYKQRC
jgi:cbb3-type cytochrome oxidase cytochrome c subunit